MTRRYSIIAALVVAALAGIRLTSPQQSLDRHDAPALALESRTSVPRPVVDVMQRACFDCHSNETRWPWYSRWTPAAWLVAWDVRAGRGQINFSRWGAYNPYDRADMLDKVCSMTKKKKMPLRSYLLLHPDARPSDADVTALCAWASAEADRLAMGGT